MPQRGEPGCPTQDSRQQLWIEVSIAIGPPMMMLHGRKLPYINDAVGRPRQPLAAGGDRGLTLVSEAVTVAFLPGITYRPIAGGLLPFSAVWSIANDNPTFRRILSMDRSKARLSLNRGTSTSSDTDAIWGFDAVALQGGQTAARPCRSRGITLPSTARSVPACRSPPDSTARISRFASPLKRHR